MIKYFNIGDLVIYKKSFHSEEICCILLKHTFSDNGGVKYFKCLIQNKIETICEVWLEKN